MSKVKVLFVCLGNICRSPVAEAVFKEKVKQRGLEHKFEADSCGTASYHVGDLPDPRTIANAEKNGIPMEHRGRQLTPDDLHYFDFILAMDKSNHQNILKLEPTEEHRNKITLMRKFDPLHKGAEVPDPYYGTERDFQEVFNILDRSLDAFIEHLVAEVLTDKN